MPVPSLGNAYDWRLEGAAIPCADFDEGAQRWRSGQTTVDE